MSLKGKTLFITGASRGIGLAIALRAARDGANIAIAAKTETPHPKLPGTIHTAAAEIEKAGGRALPLAVDVREEAAVQAMRSSAPPRISAASTSWSTMRAPIALTRGRRHRHAPLRPDASDQRARHLHGVEIRDPASRQGREPAHPDAVAAARHGGEMVRAAHRLYHGEVRHEHGGAGPCRRIAAAAASPSTRCGRAPPSPPRRSRTCSAARRSCAARARPDILADAAYRIFEKPAKSFSGNFLIDDTFLAAEGVTDFERYRVDPSVPLAPDFFVPDDIAAARRLGAAARGAVRGALAVLVGPCQINS